MSQLVPDVLTPITTGDLYTALGDAWQRRYDADATRPSLLVLLAHWALETGRGASMHCYNLGNAKHVDGDGRDWCQFRCNEVIDGHTVWIDPPAVGCQFRAFDSLESGADDYLELLIAHFSSAWQFVLQGDPTAFALRLHALGYYTANPGVYAASMRSLFAEFDREIAIPYTEPTDPTGSAV